MSDSPTRHHRALAVLPTPVRQVLRDDADLSEWSDFVVNTIETSWADRRDVQSLDEIPAGEVLMCHRFLRRDVIAGLEARAEREQLAAVAPIQLKLADDPWSLDYRERRDLREALARHQADWLPRLAQLVEPPELATTFPAFLLATTPFHALAEAIGGARQPQDLDTGTADQLQRFVDRYRDYMIETEIGQELERELLLAATTALPEILQPVR